MGQTISEKGRKVTVEGRKSYLTSRKLSQDKFCPEVNFKLGKSHVPSKTLWLQPTFSEQSVHIL